jgi:hypothetical protein
MGLRFRRSIKIAPGIRLNLSGSGLSTTIGPRGASVNIGRHGTFLNTGIPGTGLYARQRIGGVRSTSSGSATGRSAYQSLRSQAREAQRAQARIEAIAQHEEHEAELASLRNVLRNRNTSRYEWSSVWASQGVFEPEREPAFVVQDFNSLCRQQAAREIPIARWLVGVTALCAPALAWGSNLIQIFATVCLVATAAWTVRARRERKTIEDRCRIDLEQKAEIDREELKRAHAHSVEIARQHWVDEEARRERIRTAPEREDLETLSGVLEEELNDESFPVPVVLDIQLDSASRAQIEFVLPELDDIPPTYTEITKTGKLSTKKMTQRDRVALYQDLCSGIALRLAYETFRILYMVQSIELFGLAELMDPATGYVAERVALHLTTNRIELATLNLDQLDPSSALTAIGGDLLCNRRGELSAISGVTGLTG